MTYDMNEEIRKAELEWGMSGSAPSSDWFSFEEGDNKVRILTPMPPVAEHFKAGYCVGHGNCPECEKTVTDKDGKEKPNKPSVKYLCYVLDYKDNKVKLAKFPYVIFSAIKDMKDSEEYAFDDMPMPYDLIIKATDAGTTKVKYTVMAGRSNSDVSEETLEKLSKMTPPDEIKAKMREKKLRELGVEVDPEEYEGE